MNDLQQTIDRANAYYDRHICRDCKTEGTGEFNHEGRHPLCRKCYNTRELDKYAATIGPATRARLTGLLDSDEFLPLLDECR